MPRIGPKPIVSSGLLLAAIGIVLFTRIGVHSTYAGTVLPALLLTGLGLGLMFSTAFNTGTYGVAPRDAGVASATVNTGQQLGGSIGTSLLNTIFASAMASYLASHLVPHSSAAVVGSVTATAVVHGYIVAFWWVAGIFLFGAIVCGTLMRRGPLQGRAPAAAAAAPAGSPPRPIGGRIRPPRSPPPSNQTCPRARARARPPTARANPPPASLPRSQLRARTPCTARTPCPRPLDPRTPLG